MNAPNIIRRSIIRDHNNETSPSAKSNENGENTISSAKTKLDSDAPKITRRSVNKPSNKDEIDSNHTQNSNNNNNNNNNNSQVKSENTIKNDNNGHNSNNNNGTVTKQPFSKNNENVQNDQNIQKNNRIVTAESAQFEEEECDRCCADPCSPEIYIENQKRELMGHESFNMNTNEEYRIKFGLQSEHMRRVHPKDWIIVHANLGVVEPELSLIIQESIDEALAEAAPKRNQKNVLISPSCMVWM